MRELTSLRVPIAVVQNARVCSLLEKEVEVHEIWHTFSTTQQHESVRSERRTRERTNLQVDAQPPSASGQDEAELLAPLPVELVDRALARFVVGVTVDAAIFILSHHHEVLEYVQDPRHLCEYQHAGPALLELAQQLVDHVELRGEARRYEESRNRGGEQHHARIALANT